MSDTLTLNAQLRTTFGNSARKLRRQKILPAVIYSKKVPSIPIQVKLSEFLNIYKKAGETSVVNIILDDQKYDCLVHDLDVHPYKNELRHVDFLAVDMTEKTVASVPLKFVGESEAVKNIGAVLVTNIDEVKVECLPNKIPKFIEVDLSLLKNFEDVIYISDLPQSQDYRILEDSDQAVVVLSYAQEEITTEENLDTNTTS